jgi:acyl-coenzyme A thioesterase PaaI-like protein
VHDTVTPEDAKRRLTDAWDETAQHQLTERHLEMRRVADATRLVMDRLMATRAPEDALVAAADTLEQVAARLGEYPHGSIYEGFAEAANSGASPAMSFFDHSPLIGKANPLAPPIEVAIEGDRVVGTATFGTPYEGPPGCVHGGFVAASFDEILGAAQSMSGLPAMTGTLTITYRKPTPLHRELRFEGELVKVDGRKVTATGRVYAGDTMTAEAEGIFITIDFDRFKSLIDERDKPATG